MVVEWNLGSGWVGLGVVFGDFWTTHCIVLAFAKKTAAFTEILVFKSLG